VAPALRESEIISELLALEEAIRKAEAEAARRLRNPPAQAERPEPSRPQIEEPDDRKMEVNRASDLGFDESPEPQRPTRPRSSLVRPEDFRPRSVRPSATQKKRPAAKLSRGQWRKLALMVMAFIALGIAAVGVSKGPEIIPSFRSPPDVKGTPEIVARGVVVPKIADRIGSPPVASSSSNDNALVAQKAMLYEEDQADPAGKRFDGKVVWRADSVSTSAGQAPEVAIRADIEIPEERIGVRWTLRSNEDKALSASHTVEIMFTLPPDFSHGGISNVPGVLMKQAESTPGVPLAGLGVKVATDLFLISLSSADADVQRNVQLLKERSWFDIPVVYNDGYRAIIVIEKGTSGERVFSDAFAAWEQ
jgi:hypothetical protein